MATYDYTPIADDVSAFKWDGATIPGDVPAWWATLQGTGAIIYDPGVPSIDVYTGLTDRVTGVALAIHVPTNYWLVNHPGNKLEVVSDAEFNERYE